MKQRQQDILSKAMADVKKVEDSGGRFNFDVADLFTKHIAEWSLQLGRDYDHLRFNDVKESVAGGRTQTGKTAFKVALAILGRHMDVAVVSVCLSLLVCPSVYLSYASTYRCKHHRAPTILLPAPFPLSPRWL